MNFNQFTIKAQEAVQKAQEIAAGNQHQQMETAHILKGLLGTDENVIGFLLKKLNVNPAYLQEKLDELIAKIPKVTGENGQYLSRDANTVLTKAQSYMKEFGDEFVAVEHLLLGLLSIND